MHQFLGQGIRKWLSTQEVLGSARCVLIRLWAWYIGLVLLGGSLRWRV